MQAALFLTPKLSCAAAESGDLIAETPVDLCPHNVSAAYHRLLAAAVPLGLEDQAVELYLEAFEQAELGEIAMFSEAHRARYDRDTPHVAADATLLDHRQDSIR